MKTYLLTIAMLCLCAVAFADEASEVDQRQNDESTSTFTLVITGMKSDKGNLRAIVARSERELDLKDEPFKKLKLPIKNGKAKIVFKGIARGEYAIKLFHDANGNEEMDTNAIEIPKEAYGFSNNARGRMGPPKYSKVRFAIDKDPMKMEIKVK